MTSEVAAGASDPFALTADPAAYCPRPAHEAALFALGERLAETPACAALVGEAGLGKTLLLRVLADRFQAAAECVYVPFPRLEPGELWRWVAAALHAGGAAGDRAAVLARARRRREEGRRLVLLVDDAGALPPETLRDLIAACLYDVGVVLALTPADVARMGGLPAPIYPIEVGPPMTLGETRTYLNARLRRADPSGVVAERLDADRLAELQRASGGVPARLHVLLDAWLRGAPEAEALEEHHPSPEPERTPEPEPAPAVAAPPPAARRPVRPAALAPEHRAFFRRRQRRRSALPLALFVLLAIAALWRFGPPAEAWLRLAGALQERTLAPRSEFPPAAAPAPQPPPEPAPLAAAPEPEALPEAESAPPEAALETPPGAAAPADVAAPPPAEPPPPEPALVEAAEAEEPGPGEPPASAESAESAPVPPPAAEPAPAPEPMPDIAAAPPSPEPPPAVAAPVAPLAPPRAGPRLSVTAEPWAEIQLDGRPVGETPIGELPVTPGPHRLRATLPDGRVIERSIEARAGDLYVVFP